MLNHYHPSPDLVKGNDTFQRHFSWQLCHLAVLIKLHHYRNQSNTVASLFPRHNSQHWQMLCTYEKLIEEEKKALDQTPTRNIIHMSMKRGENTAQKTNLLAQEDTRYSKACDSAKWRCWHRVSSELLHVSTRILACSLMCVIVKSSNSSAYKQPKSYTYALNSMTTFSLWEIPSQLTYTWNMLPKLVLALSLSV